MAIVLLTTKFSVLTTFAAIAIPCVILILWFTRPLPDWFGIAYPYGCEDFQIAHLRQLESRLIKIRRNRRFSGYAVPVIGLVSDIPVNLQIRAIRAANDLAFEVFLLEEVWEKMGGANYRRFRLEESPYRKQIERNLLPEQIKSLIYGNAI